MSALHEYNQSANLLAEIFQVSRDIMLVTNAEIYSMKNRLKGHVESMISCQLGDRNMGERIVLRIGCDTSSAEEHCQSALQALDDLYALLHSLSPLDNEIKFLKSKIVTHMECFITIHSRQHEDRYYEMSLPEIMRVL